MNKFRQSWALLRSSLCVLAGNKKLLLFPILSFPFLGAAMLIFVLPILLWDSGQPYADPAHWQTVAHRLADWHSEGEEMQFSLRPGGYAALAAIYLFGTFLATFFNVAFYSQILHALAGRPVSFLDGLRAAWSRIGPILVWSLFTGLVGLAIRALEERVGFVGRWIVGLLGIAWSVASVFVVPALVLEPKTTNPLHYLKTSALLLKRTWGESLIGFVGLHFGGLLIFLGSLGLLGLGAALSAAFQTPLFIALFVVLWLLSLLGLMYLLNVAGQVFLGALYLYAVEGAVPAPFDAEQMNSAWKRKKEKKA